MLSHYLHVLLKSQLDWFHILYKANIKRHVKNDCNLFQRMCVCKLCILTWKNKIYNMKLLFIDLYCTTNHVDAINRLLLEGRKVTLRGFSQSFFTLVYCWFIFKNGVRLLLLFPSLWALITFFDFFAFRCMEKKIIMSRSGFKIFLNFYHDRGVGASSTNMLDNIP